MLSLWAGFSKLFVDIIDLFEPAPTDPDFGKIIVNCINFILRYYY